ncbi:MAG: hypothetical protein ACOY93_14785 [Bacillota bacterium]
MLERGKALGKSLLYLAWHLGFWLNGILAVLIILEQELGAKTSYLPRWLFATFAVAGLLHGFIQSFVRRFLSRDLARQFLGVFLETMLPGIPRSGDEEAGIRANVMTLAGNRLKAVAWCRMENQRERDLKWTLQTGSCGLAARNGMTVFADLEQYKGKEYTAILYPEDMQPRWGLTEEHWAYVRDLGSMVSIPLFASASSTKVIGVLNIDARVGLEKWLPKSQQEEFLASLQHQRGLLAWALQLGEY